MCALDFKGYGPVVRLFLFGVSLLRWSGVNLELSAFLHSSLEPIRTVRNNVWITEYDR